MYMIELTKRLSILVAALMVAGIFAGGCGTTDDSDGNGGDGTTTDAGGRGRSDTGGGGTTTDTGGGGTTTDTGGTPTLDTGITTEDTGGGTGGTPAERLCDRIIACFDEVTCTEAVSFDRAACVTSANGQGVTAQDAATYEATSCDEINRGTCAANPEIAGVCECPEVPQGDCPAGQFCSVGLRDESGAVSYACGTEAGDFPADAAVCSQAAPCAGATDICVVTELGATEGSCLQECTP